MLEERASWILSEMDAAVPELPTRPNTPEELKALARSLNEQFGDLPHPKLPRYRRSVIEEHRDRSVAFVSYSKVRQAARESHFTHVTSEHMTMLGKPLDSDHLVVTWQPLLTVPDTLPAAKREEFHRTLVLMTTLNLSTRERVHANTVILSGTDADAGVLQSASVQPSPEGDPK